MRFITIALAAAMLTACAGIPYDAALIRQPTEAELRQAIQWGQYPTLGSQHRARIHPDGTVTLERY